MRSQLIILCMLFTSCEWNSCEFYMDKEPEHCVLEVKNSTKYDIATTWAYIKDGGTNFFSLLGIGPETSPYGNKPTPVLIRSGKDRDLFMFYKDFSLLQEYKMDTVVVAVANSMDTILQWMETLNDSLLMQKVILPIDTFDMGESCFYVEIK